MECIKSLAGRYAEHEGNNEKGRLHDLPIRISVAGR
jgi:hypothetical protein